MTGFGSAEGSVSGARVIVEVRSVNHRFFNPTIRLSGALSRWETEVREALRKKVSRGHVSLMGRMEEGAGGASRIDEERFAAYVAQLQELQKRHALDGSFGFAEVLRLPDVLRGSDELGEEAGPVLLAIVEAAADALNGSRAQEGARLATYLAERLEVVGAAVDRIALRAPERVVAHRDRLRQAVRDLLEGAAVDEQRLTLEIAILAEKMDVDEELSRFRSHIAAFRETLTDRRGEPVGKRLGFLLQEMLRETNTTGSKASDVPILSDVVTIKEELERLREQVENLE